jgi:hypothetical protein
MESRKKVFLSYRSVDRDRVRAIAEALRKEGIDAWWDVWEIVPGENFVSKINEALGQYDCGVVFLSHASPDGPWQQDEIAILKAFAVKKNVPLIPVLLDADAEVPPILQPYASLLAHQVRELAEAIVNRTSNRPALGDPHPASSRVRFSIHLREMTPGSAIGVSA